MKEVHQIIIIIPVVMNLKGNLEMNLSARLGTAANVGELDDKPTRRKLIIGNLLLLQVQAAIVSFIAALIAMIIGMVLPRVSSAPATDISNMSNDTVRAIFETARSVSRPIPKPSKEGYGTFTFVKYAESYSDKPLC
jgi:solute carrier family 41